MKKLGKLGVAVALAGLFVVGCGDSGLVKLENKNPTIDQKKYDLYVQALNESDYAKEYEFYHIESLQEYKPVKENELQAGAKELIRLFKNNESNGLAMYVFATKKDNKDSVAIMWVDSKYKSGIFGFEFSFDDKELLNNEQAILRALRRVQQNSQ